MLHTKLRYAYSRYCVLSLLGPGSHLCASVTCSVLSALGRPHPRRRVSRGGRRLLGGLGSCRLGSHVAASGFSQSVQIRAHAPFDMYAACNVDKTTQGTGFHCSHVPEKVALSHFFSPGPGGTWGVSSSSCSSLNSAGLKWHLKLSPAASLNSSRPFAHTWFLTRLGLAVGVGGRIRGKC